MNKVTLFALLGALGFGCSSRESEASSVGEVAQPLQTKPSSSPASAAPGAQEAQCAALCDKVSSLACKGGATCKSACAEMASAFSQRCPAELAAFFRCLNAEPAAHFECSEEGIPSVLSPYCDRPQSLLVQCTTGGAT